MGNKDIKTVQHSFVLMTNNIYFSFFLDYDQTMVKSTRTENYGQFLHSIKLLIHSIIRKQETK